MGNYKIGDKLQYGQYPEIIGGKIVQIPIDWTIVKTRKDGSAIAIADKVIDCCMFDKKSNEYNDSFLKKYVKFVLAKNVFIPSEKQLRRWFPNAEDRRAEATDYAINKGALCDENGYARYWTVSPSVCYWVRRVRRVTPSGQFANTVPDLSTVGIRPTIVLRSKEI